MRITPNEFWLSLHRLAESYEAEGLTSDERAENIGRELERMPPTVQRESLKDLALLAVDLCDLHPLMAARLSHQHDGHQAKDGAA